MRWAKHGSSRRAGMAHWAAADQVCGMAHGVRGEGRGVIGVLLFDFYRRALVVVVTTYSTIRLIQFIWHWRLTVRGSPPRQQVLWRYVTATLWRTRIRPFRRDLVEIGLLIAVLGWVISRHYGAGSGG